MDKHIFGQNTIKGHDGINIAVLNGKHTIVLRQLDALSEELFKASLKAMLSLTELLVVDSFLFVFKYSKQTQQFELVVTQQLPKPLQYCSLHVLNSICDII